MLAEASVLAKFDAKLLAEGSGANQRRMVKEALRDVIGVNPSQWFRKLDANSSAALVLSVPEKLFINKRPAQQTDAADVGENEDLGLLNLFAK